MPEAQPAPARRDRPATERAILDAARACFAELGYSKATIRRIAGRAGVDPSLVIQYFGSKAGLFSSVMDVQQPLAQVLAHQDHLGRHIADVFLRTYESDADWVQSALGAYRSAPTEPAAAQAIRDSISRIATVAIAERIDAPDSELRISVIGSMLVGLLYGRHLIDLSVVRDADIDAIVHYVSYAFEAVLDADTFERSSVG